MAVRKIRGWWWVDFRHNFVRYRKKSPLNTKTGAEAYEATLRARLARGEPVLPSPTLAEPTLREYASGWLETYVTRNKPSEQRTKRLILERHLLPACGDLELRAITPSVVDAYKAKKGAEGYTPKTINNHLAVLGKCLRCAYDDGSLAQPPRPMKHVPIEDDAPFDYLSFDELGQLLADRVDPVWNSMVLLAARTGMRRGELLGLDWSQVDLQRCQVHVRRAFVEGAFTSPKSKKFRHLPLTDDVVASLSQPKRRAGLVFCRASGAPFTKAMAYPPLWRMCKRVGLRRIGWHVLRHTFASHLAMAGVDLHTIMKLMGHSSLEMTMRYAHLAPDYLAKSVSMLPGLSPSPRVDGQPAGTTPEPVLHRQPKVVSSIPQLAA